MLLHSAKENAMAQNINKLRSKSQAVFDAILKSGGFGAFIIRWRRGRDGSRFTIESVPSPTFIGSPEEIEASIGSLRDFRCGSPVTISDVNDHLIRLLWQQWNSKAESGSISVGCRKQANGNIRVSMFLSIEHRDLVIKSTESLDSTQVA